MTTAAYDAGAKEVGAPASTRPDTREIRIALLGLGRIGSAVADRLDGRPAIGCTRIRVSGALARSERGPEAPRSFRVHTDPVSLFAGQPDAIVEVIGGLEPARTLILQALARRVPVVTANKSVIAVHGDELFEAARRFRTPLRCEATALAGVPFLGTFAARPLAAAADGVTGILNGTTNFILSRIEAGARADDALAEAQRGGLAEPDAAADLDGRDAAEKLAILVRHFAGLSVDPGDIPSTPIAGLEAEDLARARGIAGRLKQVALARWTGNRLTCFVGPAFLHETDPLAALDGVLNGIRLERRGCSPLQFTGPGAGPQVTAATILDDVLEAVGDRRPPAWGALPRAVVEGPARTSSYVSLSGGGLPDPADVADLLGAYGIWVRRWGAVSAASGRLAQSLLTLPCDSDALELALHALQASADCSVAAYPVVEAARA